MSATPPQLRRRASLEKAGDEYVCIGPVKLLALAGFPVDRADLEEAALRVVENRREHAGRVESRDAQPIDRAVNAYQSGTAPVTDDPVVAIHVSNTSSSLDGRWSPSRRSVPGDVVLEYVLATLLPLRGRRRRPRQKRDSLPGAIERPPATSYRSRGDGR